RRRQFSHRRPEETECFEPRRGAEQARKRLIAGETPAVEHERAVQQLRREREIVRDHEQRGSPTSRSCPPCSLEQRAGDARAQGAVESGGGLIEHEQGGREWPGLRPGPCRRAAARAPCRAAPAWISRRRSGRAVRRAPPARVRARRPRAPAPLRMKTKRRPIAAPRSPSLPTLGRVCYG